MKVLLQLSVCKFADEIEQGNSSDLSCLDMTDWGFWQREVLYSWFLLFPLYSVGKVSIPTRYPLTYVNLALKAAARVQY